jgi:hypothetical protein
MYCFILLALIPLFLLFVYIASEKLKLKGKIMNLVEMKEGLDYIQDICEKENDDYVLYCEIFKGIRLGDTGVVKCISLSEIEYCKNIGYEDEEELQEHIDSLGLINKFCIIPYPDDIEHEFGEDYLIFLFLLLRRNVFLVINNSFTSCLNSITPFNNIFS